MMEQLYSLAGHHNWSQSETSPSTRDARSWLCLWKGPWTCRPAWAVCQDLLAAAKMHCGLLSQRQR